LTERDNLKTAGAYESTKLKFALNMIW